MSTLTQLTSGQQTRYRGHLSLDGIGTAGQQAIASARVLVAGAGGLGSPVSLYLAAAGVGTIGLIDADTVSLSNLQRQVIHTTADLGRRKTDSAAEKLRAINPEITVNTLSEPLTAGNAAGIMADYDIIMDCTDNLPTRLLINDTCVRIDKKMVSGAVSRFSGQVFSHVPGSACYRCIFDPEATGGTESGIPCSANGILNTVVGVIGSLQATEALKLIAGTGDALTNRLLTFDAATMTFNTFDISPVDGCACKHG